MMRLLLRRLGSAALTLLVASVLVFLIMDVLPGNAAAYFPEANQLLPIDSVSDRSLQPTAKYIVITVEKTEEPRLAPDRPWFRRLLPSSLAP